MRALRSGCPVLAVAALLAAASPALAWLGTPPTLRQYFATHPVIVQGVASIDGATKKLQFTLSGVIKGPARLRPGQTLPLTTQFLLVYDGPTSLLVAGRFAAGGSLAASHAEKEPSAELVAYVKGIAALPAGDTTQHTAFFLRHLGHREPMVAHDALREVSAAAPDRLRQAACDLSPDAVVRWLKEAAAEPDRMNLCARLLGICGKPEHAAHLDQLVQATAGADVPIGGVLCSYVLLRPAQGWEAVRRLLHDPTQPFYRRYSALLTVRFFCEERPGVLLRSDLVQALVPMLSHSDLADFVLEDLRKWRRWELAEQVLRVGAATDTQGIRRAALRFALQCPEAAAAEFVRRARQRDREWVADNEEFLRLEAEARAARR